MEPRSPLFPRLIHAYRTQRPKVNIALRELSSLLQIEAIEQRELDVGLLRLPDDSPRAELVFTPLMEEPLLLAMPTRERCSLRRLHSGCVEWTRGVPGPCPGARPPSCLRSYNFPRR
jgi:DNA-binding transcriptional LysR family regulator